jgi:hypothetical protein
MPLALWRGATVSDCLRALEVDDDTQPVAVCSLVSRVERVEDQVHKVDSAVQGIQFELRSQSRRLTLIVGAISLVSPHLTTALEWIWSHSHLSVVSILAALLG